MTRCALVSVARTFSKHKTTISWIWKQALKNYEDDGRLTASPKKRKGRPVRYQPSAVAEAIEEVPQRSGDNLEDCFNKMIDDMYSDTKGRQTVPSESPKTNANSAQQESEETSDVEEENNFFVVSPEKPHRPDTWFFSRVHGSGSLWT